MIERQSSFSRSLANEEKLGAYYTDLGQCSKIANLLSFPSGKEVTVLEPSIGDGTAVCAVVRKEAIDSKHIYGVELSEQTYQKTAKENADIEYLLNADFLNDVQITNGGFSMCFTNPPYGEDPSRDRYERRFVEKIYNYLRTDGVLVAVVPSYVASEDRFLRTFLSRYIPIGHYKFDENVYSQFKQVCLVGTKKKMPGLTSEEFGSLSEGLKDIEKYPYLPDAYAPIVEVPPCQNDKVVEFTTRTFDPDKIYPEVRKQSGLYASGAIGKKAAQAEYTSVSIGSPIVPLSPSMCYLISTVGGGSGLCGSEAERNLHLQRGVAEVVKTEEVIYDEATKTSKIVEVTKPSVSMMILESNGTVTKLS